MFRKDGTAQGVAKQRLIESLAQPEQRVIYDPYAEPFVKGAGVIKLMGHRLSVWITQQMAPGFHQHLIARTRFIDDQVEQAAERGAEQYLILGAGYDMRAHRLSLPPTTRVFEVDQAEVQQRKRAIMPKELEKAGSVSYVSVDFNHQSLSEQLLAAGFDPKKSTVITLEGVSQYISKEALAGTLEELAKLLNSAPRATFVMSYVDERLRSDPAACFGFGYPQPEKRAKIVTSLSAKVGEPWVSFYSEQDLSQMLAEYGFKLTENKSLEDLNDCYFTPVGRELPENQIFKLEHFVVAEKAP